MLWKKTIARLVCVAVVAVAASGTLSTGCAPGPAVETPAAPTETSVAPTPTVTGEVVPTATPSPEQKLVIAVETGPRMLDPDDQAQPSMLIYRLMYDKLVEINTEGELVPSLAESWEVVDETTWRFHLREGVSFHNGEPFNAESVKWTVDFNIDPDNNRMAGTTGRGLRDVVAAEVVDEHTVDLITEAPSAVLPANLTIVDMLPAKYYGEVGSEAFNDAPVGTGMFKYVDWRRDEYIRLEANEDYWGGAPTIQELEFRIIPEASARMAALRAGEVDMADRVPPEQADTLEQEGFQVVPTVFGQSWTIMMGRETQRAEPLEDVRVRRALNYAIDQDALVDDLTQGWARKLEGQLAAPDTFGHNPDVEAFPYDPEKAAELLEEAGYGDGFTVPFKCTQGRYFMDKECCEVVAAQLAEVGVTTDLEILESAVWAERFLNNTLDEGGLWVIGWNTLPAMDVTISYVFWTSQYPFQIWESEEFEELYVEQASTLEAEDRLPILHRMAEVLKEEAAAIFLYELPTAYGMDPGVQGMAFRPDGSIDISEAYIE